jgi:hypothetical protein
MTTQVPTTSLTNRVSDELLEEAVAHWWNRALRAGLHPNLITLACSLKEEPYLLRLVGDQVESLGPLPRAVCIGKNDKELPTFTVSGFDWQPATDALLDDLNPYGSWYVAQETPDGTRYIQHTQGYQDALSAFLRTPEAEALMDQPWQVGRVRCLLLFPNGSFATAPDASAQPIVLPMREENDAKELRSHLDDLLMERTWPGSL